MSNQLINRLSGVWAERFAAQQSAASQPVVETVEQPVVQPVVQSNKPVRPRNNSHQNGQPNTQYNVRRSRQQNEQSNVRRSRPHNNTELSFRYTVTVNGQVQKPQSFNKLDEKVREALVTAQTYLTNLCVDELKRGLNEDSQLQCLDYLVSYSGRLRVDGSDIAVGDYTFNCMEVSNDEHWQSRTRSLLGKVAPQLYCKFYFNNNQLVMNLRK